MSLYLGVMAIFLAVLAFLANPHGPFGEFWPPAPGTPLPSPFILPFFVLLNICEAVSLSVAILFCVFAWPKTPIKNLTLWESRLGVVSLSWLLGNWWLHDSLHVHFGMELSSLILIEYLFHVTAMIAIGYCMYLVHKMLRSH